MVEVTVIEHEHRLTLIDLQVKDEDVEQSDDDDEEEEEEEGGDLNIQDEFVCTCGRCHKEINAYYRYYYKCDSCRYSLHKFCAEVPTTLKHTSHSHPLTLTLYRNFSFFPRDNSYEVRYECSESCSYYIDVSHVVEADKTMIRHPCHTHPLVSLISKSIICECNACGREHKGTFFQCTTCPNFAIHSDCAFLPKRLLIQKMTRSFHTHPLTLSYCLPIDEKKAKYYPKCRVCKGSFSLESLWIYKCEKCIYYCHVNCATPTKRNRTLAFSLKPKNVGTSQPDIPQLPFPNQTYSIPKHLFFEEFRPTTYEVSLQHIKHRHKLILVNSESIRSTFSKIDYMIICHNPMKKIELLCNLCLRPIIEMPFYKCGTNEDEGCNFALHEWCTRLPKKVENHLGHPQHALILMSKVPGVFYNIFYCAVCCLPCNGYGYGCVKCQYYIDVCCGLMPEKVTHKSHPDHILSIVKETLECSCVMCLLPINPVSDSPYRLSFKCDICNVHIHPECALLLPETIRHSYDIHPMHLSYFPIENHKSEYFCEICECELNPHSCFYHCKDCVQSVHSTCAPLILCCETETYSFYRDNIYRFINVKFGSIHKTKAHPHPLSFAQGIFNDGKCNTCGEGLQYNMILKCLECHFAVHALKTQCRSVLSSLLPPYIF